MEGSTRFLTPFPLFSFQLLNFLGGTRPKQRLLGLHAVFGMQCMAGTLFNQRILLHNPVLAYSQYQRHPG